MQDPQGQDSLDGGEGESRKDIRKELGLTNEFKGWELMDGEWRQRGMSYKNFNKFKRANDGRRFATPKSELLEMLWGPQWESMYQLHLDATSKL